VKELQTALNADYVVLGGGNVKKIKALPPKTRWGSNGNAFIGGYRLWTCGPRNKVRKAAFSQVGTNPTEGPNHIPPPWCSSA
jgi:hypothetical protein